MAKKNKFLVASLCLEDLRHEWLLTLCMVMAVAAVLAPLLILFGLKHGTIETLRQRLVMDPRNSEIRPMDVRSFSQQWFEEIKRNHHIRFVVPTTRQLASSVDILTPASRGKGLSVDAIPTAANDPLIIENGCLVPGDKECLLSALAAEESGLGIGDELIMSVKRVKGSGFETATIPLRVKGILPIRAGATKSLYIQLGLLESVENFKDGMGVPSLGWPGDIPRAYPVFSHLLIATPAPLGPEETFLVVSNTGFTKVSPVSAQEARNFLQAELAPDHSYYLLETKGGAAGASNIQSVANTLRGKQAVLYPANPDLSLALYTQSGESLGEKSLYPTWSMVEKGKQGTPVLPHLKESPWNAPLTDSNPSIYSLLVPGLNAGPETAIQGTVTVSANDNVVSIPVRLVPVSPNVSDSFAKGQAEQDIQGGHVYAPLPFIGKLGLLPSRPLVWDITGSEILLSKRGYAGFRLYAKGLEEVALVKQFFESQGIAVNTEAERIDDVMRLDKYLSLIFWLIALASIVGGTACLIANIYAGIERKRIELAVLRLLGLSGGAFIRFPLYIAAFYASVGSLVAFIFFTILSVVINSVFASHLQQGESLCSLAWWHPIAVYALTLFIALIAGAIAARRAMSIEPAEALRNE